MPEYIASASVLVLRRGGEFRLPAKKAFWHIVTMLSDKQREASMRLWDEIADFPAAMADDALRHFLQMTSAWMACEDVAWLGTLRLQHGRAAGKDMQHGWRVVALRRLNPAPVIELRSEKAVREQDTKPSMMAGAIAAEAGKLRVRRLHDGFVDLRAFKKTEPYRRDYEQPGISDRMVASIPIHGEAETHLQFDRYGAARRFSKAEAEWMYFTMRGLKWFFRELMLSQGLWLAGAPLSPVERRIVKLLLTDRSEKEIAAEMSQSVKTTHKYIAEILYKYGVRGRIGLMALWLGRRN